MQTTTLMKISESSRTKQYVRKLLEEGGSRVTFQLSPAATSNLNNLSEATGLSRTKLINLLIVTATQETVEKLWKREKGKL